MADTPLRLPRRTLLGASLAAGGSVLGSLLAAPRSASAQAARGKPLTFVPQADLTVLDPVWTTATVTLTHGYLVFDTLYGMDQSYRVSPQMAAGHVVEDDGRRWIITLRDGLKFHDGEPVRAQDAAASIRRWAARDMYGQALLGAADSIAALDDKRMEIRLKQPFPLVDRALGKAGSSMPCIMPERLAKTPPATQVTEMIGSGPYRFIANERVVGARVVYERFADYQPRPDGVASRTAGPKVAHFDRVEWHIIPDQATAAAALQAGEVDWLEITSSDIAPMLKRDRGVTVAVADDRSTLIMRPNHLHPPFNNPGIRRALLGAVQQSSFLTAAFGDDRTLWRDNGGVFLSETPMANAAGMEVLTSPRDMAKVKQDLAAAGYKGERVVVLQANDFPMLQALAQVGADMLQRAGMNVDVQAGDWGTVVQRRASKEPVEKGGWSVFFTGLGGPSVLDPVGHLGLRANGQNAWFGWPTSEKLEALRSQWINTGDLAAQQQICRQIQLQTFQDVPFLPLGDYSRLSAYRADLRKMGVGFPTFWGLQRA